MQWIPKLKKLPRFLARIRTGNDEEIRFFKDIEAKTGFIVGSKYIRRKADVISREIELNNQKLTQRISIHEIFETNEIEKVLSESRKFGELTTHLRVISNKSDFKIILNAGNEQKKRKLSMYQSVSKFLENYSKSWEKRLADPKV